MINDIPQLGSSVSVWWSEDDRFYNGVVQGPKSPKEGEGKFVVKYDDEEEEDIVDFNEEVWRYRKDEYVFKGSEEEWTEEENVCIMKGVLAGDSNELIGLRIGRTKLAVKRRRYTRALKDFMAEREEVEKSVALSVYEIVLREAADELIEEQAWTYMRSHNSMISRIKNAEEKKRKEKERKEKEAEAEEYDSNGNLIRLCGINGCTFKCSSIDQWTKHKFHSHPGHMSKKEKMKQTLLIEEESGRVYKKVFDAHGKPTKKKGRPPTAKKDVEKEQTISPNIKIGQEDVFQVDEILERRAKKGRYHTTDAGYEYKVKWVGGEITWEPKENINKGLLKSFTLNYDKIMEKRKAKGSSNSRAIERQKIEIRMRKEEKERARRELKEAREARARRLDSKDRTNPGNLSQRKRFGECGVLR
ncbi:hypothetical protein TrLO_g1939 [Triparma laevis f. longispina]|uniref:Chromo domain-containing protein n=1 Tax=Triparma laevis f. longispina TaxID=1714387 RepID=A0A9W7AN25_9STRA|nr:hypothetical protein TrLO_g1939 [Triparma laevis f. longispina]